MLSKALREFMTGPLKQLFVNLAGEDGSEWEEELKKFLRKESCWTSLFEAMETVSVPETSEAFIACKKFVCDTDPAVVAKIGIKHLNRNFMLWFLAGDGTIEDPMEEQTLRYAKLREDSLDGPIVAALGGGTKARTTLTAIYALIAQQAIERDALVCRDLANIFYVRDCAGILRTVSVHRVSGGWSICAHLLGGMGRWFKGCRVFSHNFDFDPESSKFARVS